MPAAPVFTLTASVSERLMVNMLLLLLLLLTASAMAADEGFKPVELDSFIESQITLLETRGAGKKMITMGAPVSFEASLKRLPEAKKMRYVYVALEVGGAQPMPVVEHRMFIESKGGRIIPVYVEKAAVARINVGLKETQQARFRGYHVYNYAKGPAILIVDFDRLAQ